MDYFIWSALTTLNKILPTCNENLNTGKQKQEEVLAVSAVERLLRRPLLTPWVCSTCKMFAWALMDLHCWLVTLSSWLEDYESSTFLPTIVFRVRRAFPTPPFYFVKFFEAGCISCVIQPKNKYLDYSLSKKYDDIFF